MLFRKKERVRNQFRVSGRRQSVQGIISAVFSVLAIVIMIVACIISGNAEGAGGVEIGIMGILSWGLVIAGFVLAVIGLRKKEVHYGCAIAGMVFNGLQLVMYFVLYIIGLIM